MHTKGLEAKLANIAAIAHVELKTKQEHTELGTAITIEGYNNRPKLCCCTKERLLQLKIYFLTFPLAIFLKSDAVELRHIIDEFHRVVLAHPQSIFQCITMEIIF